MNEIENTKTIEKINQEKTNCLKNNLTTAGMSKKEKNRHELSTLVMKQGYQYISCNY